MSLLTPNYNLIKPELSDPADITALNPNWEKIDSKFKTVDEALQSVSEGGGSSGKRTTRFTVGTTTTGWGSSDCDYLCDGTADETQINQAIQALGNDGGEIVLLDGTYSLSAPIVIDKDNVILKGNGASTKLVRAYNDSMMVVGMIIIDASFCTIEKLYFDSAKTTHGSEYNVCIYISSGENNTISNNVITNNSGNGMELIGNGHTIINNTIIGCKSGMYASSAERLMVVNNFVTNSASYGIHFSNVKHTVFNNNICNGNVNAGMELANSNNCTITGNAFNSNNGHGLFLSNSNICAVAGNMFNSNTQYGVVVNNNSKNCTVATNTYMNNTSGEYKDDGTNNIVEYAPMWTYGTTDLTAGSSPLATGKVHLVYE